MFASRCSSFSVREAAAVPRLLAEGAHHAHAGQRLLEIGGDLRDPLAREPVGPGRGEPERHARHQQDREGQERDQGEARVEQHQDHRGADERERGREERRDALGHELVERLDVVRQARDQDARPVARVEADRQPLEVLEHLDPEVLERPLAHPVDEVGLQVGGDPVQDRRGHERDHDQRQRVHVLLLDALVDRAAGEVWRRQRGRGRDEERDEHQQHAPAIRAQQADQVAQAAGAIRIPHRPATSRSGSSRVRNTWSGRPFSAISR